VLRCDLELRVIEATAIFLGNISLGWFTLGTITNFNLNFMTLVIKFSLKIWLHPNLPKQPDIEV
jgi:hypothetical protein